MVNAETTRVAALYVYPIKSCRGISVDSSELLREGLEFDRRFMFVDSQTRKFLTIRQNPKMTLIVPSLTAGHNTQLVISVKGVDGQVSVPARPTDKELSNMTVETVEIWGNQLQGHIFPAETSAMISQFLGQEVSLVYHHPDTNLRLLSGNGSLRLLGRSGSVGYADVLPVQIASLASLDELNSRLVARGADEITIERFRPNIVVEGLSAWDEDTWLVVSLIEGPEGKIVIDCVCHCARCQVPNVGPDNGIKDKHEPWDTLVR